MTPPLIGLTGRRKSLGDIAGYPDSLSDLSIDMYFADYGRGVIEAGGVPVHLPLAVDPEVVIERLDGVLLSGGADVEPARYGADAHSETVAEPQRDAFELALLAAAERRGVPILGICRGLQLINVAKGGTLHQHEPEHARYDVAPASLSHKVSFEAGSQCRRLFGDSIPVNSLHHQTVDVVAPGLAVVGRSDDGTVEAMEAGDDLLAVQWHPEMLPTRPTDPVFSWLVERAS